MFLKDDRIAIDFELEKYESDFNPVKHEYDNNKVLASVTVNNEGKAVIRDLIISTCELLNIRRRIKMFKEGKINFFAFEFLSSTIRICFNKNDDKVKVKFVDQGETNSVIEFDVNMDAFYIFIDELAKQINNFPKRLVNDRVIWEEKPSKIRLALYILKIITIVPLLFTLMGVAFALFGQMKWTGMYFFGGISLFTFAVGFSGAYLKNTNLYYEITESHINKSMGAMFFQTTFGNIKKHKCKTSIFNKSKGTVKLYLKKGLSINYHLEGITNPRLVYDLIKDKINNIHPIDPVFIYALEEEQNYPEFKILSCDDDFERVCVEFYKGKFNYKKNFIRNDSIFFTEYHFQLFKAILLKLFDHYEEHYSTYFSKEHAIKLLATIDEMMNGIEKKQSFGFFKDNNLNDYLNDDELLQNLICNEENSLRQLAKIRDWLKDVIKNENGFSINEA